MTKLLLKDVMNRVGIDPTKVKLIRHSKSDARCKKCIDKNMLKEYMAVQKTGFSKGYDYGWFSLVEKELLLF